MRCLLTTRPTLLQQCISRAGPINCLIGTLCANFCNYGLSWCGFLAAIRQAAALRSAGRVVVSDTSAASRLVITNVVSQH